jgi:hypothetical protein
MEHFTYIISSLFTQKHHSLGRAKATKGCVKRNSSNIANGKVSFVEGGKIVMIRKQPLVWESRFLSVLEMNTVF